MLSHKNYSHDDWISLIETYYSPFESFFNLTQNNDMKSNDLYSYADRIFMQSIYLIPILHYGQIMGNK